MEAAPLSARDRILGTAHDLFYRDGIRATGIDRLIAESGVTKVTFYRHFPSKNDLVRAFLDLRHARWMAWFVDALGRRGADTPAAPPTTTGPSGQVFTPATVIGVTIQFATPDPASVDATVGAVRAIAGGRGATTSSLALGGTSVMRVAYAGTPAELAAALRARGFTVREAGGGLSISR